MARQSWRNQWVYPMLTLSALAAGGTFALFAIDHYIDSAGFSDPITHYLSFDGDAVSNSIGVLSSIIGAVLGIIVTVVSIVVQLAATRFTPAVTEMFFRDRTNLAVMALYVVGCVIGFWTAFGVNGHWVPRVSLIVMLMTATLGFVLMAPYFAYVFRFLSPSSVVSRLQREAQRAALGTGRVWADLGERQAAALTATEQLTDIAINSISQKDKMIATSCVDAMRDATIAYLDRKAALASSWFQLSPTIWRNPDFASMARDSVEDLEANGTWFEFKQLRQYQAIYTEALGTMRDINYVIAINTRLIAERALAVGQIDTLYLAVKFFNTYMRATLNQNDVRTAYTILNQYRLLVENVLRAGEGQLALKFAAHIKYYGHLSYQKRLAFVTETVAYDLGTLLEVAHEIRAPNEPELLRLFLEADPIGGAEGEVQEASLRGVRKAQVKLATAYLVDGADDLARLVWEDMRDEAADRLGSIRDELLSIETKDFWEISDRGGNFDYLSPARKEKLRVFFGWFRDVSGELQAVSLDSIKGESR